MGEVESRKSEVESVKSILKIAVTLASLAACGAALGQVEVDAERCSIAAGTVDETIAACTRAIDAKRYSGADLAILHNNRGISWREKGFDDVALADFDEAVRLDPGSATARVSRGNLLGDRGENEKAIADYDEAIRINPKLAPAYSNRGLSWLARGDTDRALADFDEAIRLAPAMTDAYNNRGIAWRVRGDAERALADFSRVIKLDPKFADAYDSMALILATSSDAKVRDGKRAVELAQTAAGLTGWKNAYYLNTLAAAHAEAGEYARAAEWQQKAIGLRGFTQAGEAAAQERLRLYRAGKPLREPGREPSRK
jgi:tetratricopeptide (TPR) repeat protein